MSRYDMIRSRPLRPGPAVEKSRPIFIMVDERRETMVKGQMLPGVRPGHSGAHPPPPPQPALVLRDQLVKAESPKYSPKNPPPEHWESSGSGDDEVIHPFPGHEAGYTGAAAKHFRKVAEQHGIEIRPRKMQKSLWPDNRVTAWADQFMGTKLYGEALQCVKEGIQLCKDRNEMWNREDRGGNNVKARIQWERDNAALRKKEDALRKRKKGLEEKLVDSRIEEEKHRSR